MRNAPIMRALFVDVRIDERQELLPGLRLVAKYAQHPAGDEVRAALADAAIDHAMMRRLDDHRNSARLQNLFNRVGDLGRQALLNLEPLGEDLDHARELGDSHHPLVRNVPDPHTPDDRSDMVLAMALKGDAAQHNHLVIAVDLAEGLVQNLVRIFFVAREIFAVGAHHTIGRFDQAVASGVLANPLEDSAERILGLRVADRLAAAGRTFEVLFSQRHDSIVLIRAPEARLPPFMRYRRILKGAAYPATLEKSATACIASRNSLSNLSLLTRVSGSGSLTVTSMKKPSTGARKVASARIAPSKSSEATCRRTAAPAEATTSARYRSAGGASGAGACLP